MLLFPFKLIKIAGHSMLPTLKPDDLALINQWIYFFRSPQVGEIIVFAREGKLFCKRIFQNTPSLKEYDIRGDNPHNGFDSKKFGRITQREILGKVIKIFPATTSPRFALKSDQSRSIAP